MSPISPASNTNLVFFIFTMLVYIAIVYIVVSVEPISVDAICPISESTPYVFIISTAIAVEALPDIGLSMASGIISFGMFIRFVTGLSMFITRSNIPDVLSTPIATNNPISVGNMLIIIFIPSFAPSINVSNMFCFSSIPFTVIIRIISGIDIVDM